MLTRFTVLVNTWQKDRQVGVDENFIYFHTTLNCGTCPTCDGRARYVAGMLTRSKAEWSWDMPEEWHSLVPQGVRIVRITRIAGELPLEQLRRQLQMNLEVIPEDWEKTSQFEQRNPLMDMIAEAFRKES